uniref:Uncharacterized protein n=1 Tax=Anopheles atroparvus TaxID=41427 RepID=A0AAG5DBL5_ANOAO
MSAKEPSIGSAKSAGEDRAMSASEPEVEQADKSPSPVTAGEDAEVSKDSLEQVIAERKDDEIDQDSLGKDFEAEESPIDREAELVRPPSTLSGREAIQTASQSRVTTGKSVKSTSATVEQDGIGGEGHNSRLTSATGDQNEQQYNHNDDAHELNGQEKPPDTLDVPNDREESGRSGRHSGRTSGRRNSNASSTKESTSPGSRPRSRADSNAESVSRAVSSTTTTGRASGKSIHSSTTNRRASIGSRKSIHSTGGATPTGQAERQQDDPNEDSDPNDDSNNADVQIVSYRAPDEASQGTSATDRAATGTSAIEDAALGTNESHLDEEKVVEEVPPDKPSESSAATDATVQEPEATPVEANHQVLEIEGVVQGEPDQGQLQSQNHQRIDLEERPNVIISSLLLVVRLCPKWCWCGSLFASSLSNAPSRGRNLL